MSGRLMKQLREETTGLWQHPAQYSTIQILCWDYRDDLGYAEVSANEIARLIGLGRRRVFMIYDELEVMLACTRLEPGDTGKAGDKARSTQKFAVTLDRALRKYAVDQVAAAAGTTKGVVISTSPGWCNQDHQGGEADFTRVVIPGSPGGEAGFTTGPPQDPRSKYQEYKATEAAARLPLLGPLPSDPPALAASMRAARAHQEAKLRDRVRGIVRSVLFNPAIGAALLNGEPMPSGRTATHGWLVSAVKAICGEKARRQPYLRGYGDVVDGICSSEWFKHRRPDVIRGTSPRPRDLKRGRS
jgi:hypothetical protein